MSRRDQITMTDAEVGAFLEEERTLTCATQGPRGWPHLMPLWFVVRDGRIWAWTFGKSQKVLNLDRDPRATLQVEAGEQYDQLRAMAGGGSPALRSRARRQAVGMNTMRRGDW